MSYTKPADIRIIQHFTYNQSVKSDRVEMVNYVLYDIVNIEHVSLATCCYSTILLSILRFVNMVNNSLFCASAGPYIYIA